MKIHDIVTRGALVLALAVVLSTTAAAQDPPASAPFDDEPIHAASKGNPGYVIDEPGLYLDRAHAAMARGQGKLAAADLRKAAHMLGREARHAAGDDKACLEADAKALRASADQVASGALADAGQLDRQLAETRQHLAAHQYLAASNAWAKQQFSDAGAALAASARYAQGGLRSLGQKAGDDLGAAARYGDGLAKRGASAVESEFKAARQKVSDGIDKLGKAVAPGKGG